MEAWINFFLIPNITKICEISFVWALIIALRSMSQEKQKLKATENKIKFKKNESKCKSNVKKSDDTTQNWK